MTRPSLAVVIPTYQRSAILGAGLERMAASLARHRVTLFISDDSPDDATEQMVAGFAARVPNVHYRRNTPALRHDQNVVESLLWPDADFVWILGDAGWIEPDAFERVIGMLGHQDLVFVNSHAPVRPDAAALSGDAARMLVRDMLWHQTLTGATIYGRRVLEWLRATAPDTKDLGRNFPHLAIILDFVATHDPVLGWIGEPSTRFAPKDSYWRAQALSVFVDDWATAVRRRPDVILPEERTAVLRAHSANMSLFHAGLLRDLRRAGTLTTQYVRSQPDFFAVMHLPRWKVEMILRLPLAALDRLIRG